jgi:hypothetical protein
VDALRPIGGAILDASPNFSLVENFEVDWKLGVTERFPNLVMVR